MYNAVARTCWDICINRVLFCFLKYLKLSGSYIIFFRSIGVSGSAPEDRSLLQSIGVYSGVSKSTLEYRSLLICIGVFSGVSKSSQENRILLQSIRVYSRVSECSMEYQIRHWRIGVHFGVSESNLEYRSLFRSIGVYSGVSEFDWSNSSCFSYSCSIVEFWRVNSWNSWNTRIDYSSAGR